MTSGPNPPEPRSSILEFLEQKAGGKTPITLRQDDSVPVLKPVEDLKRSGKYQLQGEIARGGVGVVLKGHDTELGRDVAFKVIRERYKDNADVLHRFVEEAQIGGQLQHPGIVPVYDIGLQEGRPFFTMKLIKGRTLAALLEEGGESRRRQLAIFEAVCQTMAYAHTRGVIHRDLKPANIMVGAFGEVQVVDWGMGKVMKSGGVEDERRAIQAHETIVATVRSDPGSVGSQSMFGSAIGTPGYMPPEQAMGETGQMDERSDVFSLGAILAEILTGEPAYPGQGIEVLQAAAEGDLEPCHARIDGCDADDQLKALAKQCLSAVREVRPRNAGEVQERIGAYLSGLEEKARAAQVEAAEERVRLAEAKRKQKLTLALAASILLTLVVGGGGLRWYQLREMEREAKLRESFQAAVLEAGRAADPAAMLAAAQRARDFLAQADMPATAVADLERLEADARTAQERARLAEENAALLATLDALRGPASEDARFEVDWADIDRQYAAAFARYGLNPDAGRVSVDALLARGETAALAAGLDDWIFARREASNLEGAERIAEVASAIDGDATRATLRAAMLSGDLAAIEKLAAEVDVKAMEARTLRLLAESLRRLAPSGSAYDFCLRAHEAHPEDFFLAHALARAAYRASRVRGDLSHKDALRYHLIARSLRPDHYMARVELAQQFINAGEYEHAERFLRDFLAERPNDAVLHGELGLVLEERGQPKAAEAQYRRAIELDAEQAWCRQTFAIFLGQRGLQEEALEHAEKAVALAPGRYQSYNVLAMVLGRLNRNDEAMEAHRRAAELAPQDPSLQLNLLSGMHATGAHDEALARCRELLAEFADDLQVQRNGAGFLVFAGELEEGLEVARNALAKAEAARFPETSMLAALHFTVARAHEKLGDPEAADEARKRALAAAPTHVRNHVTYAMTLHEQQRFDEAIPILERVVVLEPRHFWARWVLAGSMMRRARHADALPHLIKCTELVPDHALAHGATAEALMPLGRAEEAVTWARRGVELDPKHPAIRHALAQALDAVGKPEEALAQLEAIEGALPPHMLALSGWLKAQIGRADEGIEELRRAAAVMPQHWLAHNYLARALLQEDRLDEALESAQRAVAVAPGNPPAEFLLGLVLGRLGRVSEAEAAYERGLANLDLVAARVELAELPAIGGDPEESVRRLRAIVASHPDDIGACGSLAWGLSTYPLAQRSPEEAIALARRVLEQKPDNDHRVLAAALFRAGKHADAERELAAFFEASDDGHACVAYLRALNLHALGETEEASRWYEEAEKRFASEGEHPLPDHRWLRDEAKRLFDR